MAHSLRFASLVLLSAAFGLSACGSSSSDSKPAPTVTAPTPSPTPGPTPTLVSFESVAPIVAANCAGSGCHSTGSRLVFVGSQKNVDANKNAIVRELSSGSMPPRGGMSQADKDALIQYCKQ